MFRMGISIPLLAAALGLAAITIACAPQASPAPASPLPAMTPSPAARPAVSPSAALAPIAKPTAQTPPAVATLGGGATVPPEADAAVQAARKDLAGRIGVAVADVRIVSVTAVDWPDASLGCPQPGMAYAQVITPGYRIVLSAGGKDYEYHSDRASRVVLC